MQSTLSKLMADGGPIMWVLLAFSVVILAAGLQRVLVFRRASGDATPLLKRVRAVLLRSGSPAKAAAVCDASKGSVARVLGSALRYEARDPEKLERYLEATALRELRRLGRGLAVIAAGAMTAPLLGFLGTVTGMMASFDVIGNQGISDPGAVAIGIKEALTTTAAGLIVAVPAQLLHQTFMTKIRHLEGELEAAANGLLELLDTA